MKHMTSAMFFKQLEEARGRIGNTAEDLMRWVIRFSRLEMSELVEAELLTVRFELAKFGESRALVGRHRDTFPWPVARGTGQLLDQELPSVKTVVMYQTKIRQVLQKIVEEREICFHTPPMAHRLSWSGEVGDPNDLSYFVTASDEPDGPYTYALIQLLASCGSYLRECNECHQIFFADRRNQTYCSNRCQTRAGTRRYRAEHGLITGRPRGRPSKDQSTKVTGSDKKRHRKR